MSKLGDEYFMRLALEQAHIGTQTPGGAEVGAVLVKDGKVVCGSFNEGNMRNDPTAHAEIVVIRQGCDELQSMTLEEYTLYCTLQPCGMCTMACLWAGVSRIVYGRTPRGECSVLKLVMPILSISFAMRSVMIFRSKAES